MRIIYLFILTIMLISSCSKGHQKLHSSEHAHTNALIDESSPYLLQHAHNPVDWMPWGPAALEKAEREQKMMIISVGYSACHWCHVMEHESFEDSLVAQIMNENFVCIKVDREERPDVDDVYMTACQLTSGRGCGWPLNAFALPDGRPVWAGTYFPKDQWTSLLKQFITIQKEDYAKLEESAGKITQGIKSSSELEIASISRDYTNEDINKIGTEMLSIMDWKEGGRTDAPKFPMPSIFEFLLQKHYETGDKKALEAVELTLDKMAYGGIYDQLGGGFARYSTDEYWLVPHFEKMLYDNSQLVSLYSHGYQVTKKTLYKDIVEQTLEFVERELMNDSYGFYSSLDADSEGEEGKFYVWQEEEINALIGDKKKADIFKSYYSVKTHGNWEETNILAIDETFEIKKTGLSAEAVQSILDEGRTLLMRERDKRIRPGLDDKILTSWNGLMLKGYIDAYKAFGTQHYLDVALKNADFILKNVTNEEGRLNRNYKDGKSSINGFLDDYATMIDAFLALYEVTFNEKWLERSEEMTQHVISHFTNEKNGMFFYTSDLDEDLIAKKMGVTDNVIPSSNSMMARNLHKLGTITYNNDYITKSKQMLANMEQQVIEDGQPNFYSNWSQLYQNSVDPVYEVAVLGDESVQKALDLQRAYLPNAYFLGGKNEGSLELLSDKLQDGRTMIYVCQNKVCKIPTDDVEKARGLID